MKKYRILFVIAALVSAQAFAMEVEQDQEALLAQVLVNNGGGFTEALFDAAKNGYTETVIVLIRRGADVRAKDTNCCTPLHYAAEYGHTQTVLALIEHGVDVRAKNNNDVEPLHYAAYHGHTRTVIALIEHDADVRAKDNKGCTPLHWAAKNGHTQTVLALIELGADVHAKDNDGLTPLHSIYKLSYLEAFEGRVFTEIDCTIVQALLLVDQGKKKTDQQVQDSYDRMSALLLCLNSKALPRDLKKKILLQFTEDIFSADMLADLLPIADKEQIPELVQNCPREWFVRASKNDVAINDDVIQEIVSDAIKQANEHCKIRTNSDKTAYDMAYGYKTVHDMTHLLSAALPPAALQAMPDRIEELKQQLQLLHPDDPEGKRAAFIEEEIKKQFKNV